MQADTSEALLNRAALSIPGGINTAKRKINPSLCVARAKGGEIEDLQGRTYLDFHCAYSAIFVGHAEEAINRFVAETVDRGTLYGVGVTDIEVELAEKIVAHVPSVEKVLLTNSGSEATYHAIRLSRGVTGRQKILKFQGGYDGYHDYVLRNVLSAPDKVGKRDPGSAGMLDAAIDHTLVCRYNDLADVGQKLDDNDGEVAAIIVEPIAHNAPTILPQPGFLEGLRGLATKHGCLLIFDEVITGFRHALGGYQGISGVLPDLTTMGKAIANGYPLAAIGGRADLMGEFSTTEHGDVLFGGTYNGNLVSAAAGLATLRFLEEEDVYSHVYKLGERMRQGLAEAARRADVPVYISGYGSVFLVLFMDGPLNNYEDCLRNDGPLLVRYRQKLLQRGIFEMPENIGRSHVMYRHTDSDIDRALDAAEQAMRSAVWDHSTSVSAA